MSPSRSERSVSVGECGAILFEEAVEGRSEALERDAEHALQTLKYWNRKCSLQLGACCHFCFTESEQGLIATQHAEGSREKEVEPLVVQRAHSIELFLKEVALRK